MNPVLVQLGCYNKNTINWCLIHNKGRFLKVLEAEKSKTKVPRGVW